ncbi:beta-1,3-galactosyltransferase pvg3 [Brachypodium distachyon]|uniref:Hexosyltransferase n=1 Tax=Brachypodium distachyon TaxID=15368 RepID=I1IL89_BRADI|nr:beta-1,3-galactosyltransferase pvg3 [Brachypodium distachyon]KQJ88276.1 hypothetical protein BRADI_4g16710v3 [Brachypodium distachyon]|eukprot:XP_010239137.1 beta-1,3-galactosyltransferase pvg3 [Brachypodium distachyon]
MASYSYLTTRPSYSLISLILLLSFALLCVSFPAYLQNPLNPAAAGVRGCFTATTNDAVAPAAATTDDQDPEQLRILVGVHTVARKHARQHLIRMAYALQQTPGPSAARVDVRFVLCARPMPPEHGAFVALEARAHGDMLLLDCAENAEDGKTYSYFAALPAMLGERERPYDYVMKVDDDTYLRLEALVETLRDAPREDMYYGVGLPFMHRERPRFMLGMGYVLSWDLVQWIAASDMVKREAKGVEDVTTGNWLNMGNKAKNRVNIYPRMYDYKSAEAEDFLENTVGLHQLKEDLKWAHTLEHFNATRLEPSSKLNI